MRVSITPTPDLARFLRRLTGGESSSLAEAINSLREAHHRLVEAEERVDGELVHRFGVDRGSPELARLHHQLKVRIGLEEPPKRRLHNLVNLLGKATLGHVDLLTGSATPRSRCRDCRGTSRASTVSQARPGADQ